MLTTAQLAGAFGRNVSIVQMQAKDLTHAESLLQPSPRGNCLNWVVGHIVENRDAILSLLGEQPMLAPAEAERYRRESQPVTGPEPDVVQLDRLLELLAHSQERLAASLQRVTPEDLARQIDAYGRTRPLGDRIFFAYFHETYHTGQTELLRQLAGKNDKVI